MKKLIHDQKEHEKEEEKQRKIEEERQKKLHEEAERQRIAHEKEMAEI